VRTLHVDSGRDMRGGQWQAVYLIERLSEAVLLARARSPLFEEAARRNLDVRALSFRTLRFRVSEPAKVTLIVNGTRIVRSVRAGTFSYRYGRVRTVRIIARDAAGNLSRTLRFP